MKHLLLISCIIVSFLKSSFVQSQGNFIQVIAEDSVRISYNQDYFLVEDSCANIMRLGRYDFHAGKFKGRFKDVSAANPKQVIAIGSYNENGFREGEFISYYPNGNLRAKGNFKSNAFNGKWDFFYPSGNPNLTFIANGNDVQIKETWTEEGKKIVDNGHGDYESIIGPIVWSGKLVGGKPDGKWIAYRMYHSEDVLVTERFKLGEFQKGRNQVGEYTDSSRINLISAEMLPLTKAENFWISREPCNTAQKKLIVNARYSKGAGEFAEEIKERLTPVLNKLNLTSFNEPLELIGKVLEDGRIVFDGTKGDSKITSSLISALHNLPRLEPAWLDGKRIQQKIGIIIRYNSSVYSFSYRFIPIETNQN